MATSGSFTTSKYSARYYKVEWKQDKNRIDWTLSAEGTATDGTTAWTFRALNLGVTVSNAKIINSVSSVSGTDALSSLGGGIGLYWYTSSFNPSVAYKNTATNSLPAATATLHYFPDNKIGNAGPRPGVVISGSFTLSEITSSNVTLNFSITANTAGYSRSADGKTTFSITIPTYTVTYKENSGNASTVPGVQTKYHGTDLILSSVQPTKNSTVTYPTGTITVKFDANGGASAPENKTGTYTNTKTVPYTFKEWNTTSSGSGTIYKPNGKYTANAPATLYAQWNTGEAKEDRKTNPTITVAGGISRDSVTETGYTVTFNTNGGSCDTKEKKSSRTKSYTFRYWNTRNDNTGTEYKANTAYTFSSDTILYAIWNPSYTNNSIILPTPTRKGYTFNGWHTAASGGTRVGAAEASYTPTANTILYAQWTANTYTVTLKDNGATSTYHTTSVTATYDSAMPSITKPLRQYGVGYRANGGSCSTPSSTAIYKFNGYYTAASGGTQYYTSDGYSARPWDKTSDTTLYAQWTSTSVKLPTPSRTGYTFNGWFTATSGGDEVGTAGEYYTPTAGIDLYAQWTANSNTKYTVKHFLMGLDGKYPSEPFGTESKTDTTGATVTLAGLAKSYTGFTYKEGKVGGSVVTSTTILADGCLVINLYYSRNQYTVTLKSDTGISAVSGGDKYYYGASVTINATVSTGHTWSNWSGTHNTTVQKYTFTMPAGGVTDTANATANTYTVKYAANGGTGTMADTVVTYGTQTPIRENSFTRAGYTFKGFHLHRKSDGKWLYKLSSGSLLWYTKGEQPSGATLAVYNNGQYTSTITSIDGDIITLYAQWTANTYTVTFNANDGSIEGDSSKKVTYNSTYDQLPTATRRGYVFNGWYTAKSGGSKITSSTTVSIAEDHKLYAIWAAEEYKVYFSDADGKIDTGKAPYTIKYNGTSTYTSKYEQVKVGYAFEGWSTNPDGDDGQDWKGKLLAKWEWVAGECGIDSNNTLYLYSMQSPTSVRIAYHLHTGSDAKYIYLGDVTNPVDLEAPSVESIFKGRAEVENYYKVFGWYTKDGEKITNFSEYVISSSRAESGKDYRIADVYTKVAPRFRVLYIYSDKGGKTNIRKFNTKRWIIDEKTSQKTGEEQIYLDITKKEEN